MVAARDLKYAARVRVNALLDVLYPSTVHTDGHMVFGLARYRASVTTDTFAIIDYKSVIHSMKVRRE